MNRNWNWVAPLCGVVFVIIAVVCFALTGEGQDPAKKSAEEIANYYKDHDNKNQLAAFLLGGAGILLLFFSGWVRQLLRAAEGEGGMLSSVSFGALIVIVAGLGVGATIHLALVDYVDDVDPNVIATINAIDYDFFIPFAVGMAAFLLSTGIAVVRTAVLPKWLGWVAIVLGVASFTPAGFFGFLGGLAFIAAVGTIGVVRSRGEAPAAPTPAA
jgi:hypothetical protein